MHPLWQGIFGNDHPVEVEIGPGTGTFILKAAAECPQRNFYSVEHSHSRAASLEAAISARRLQNARVIAANATCVVTRLIPSHSVGAYHIYFPDPWWKRRHQRRRLFTPEFVAALAHTLTPHGRLYVATDVDDVFALITATVGASAAFAEDPRTPSPRWGPTTFERKGLARGARILEATFINRGDEHAAAPPQTSRAAPITPAESPSTFRRIGVRSSSLNT